MSTGQSNYMMWKGWETFGQIDARNGRRFAAECTRSGLKAPSKLLEIGFGAGTFLRWARDNGYGIVGIEQDGELLKRARLNNFLAHDSLSEAATEAPNGFDGVVAFDVIEHLSEEQFRGMLEELGRIMRPQAKAIFQFPNGSSPLVGHIFNGDLTHKMLYTRNSLEQLLITSPFVLVGWHQPYPVTDTGLKGSAMRAIRAVIFRLLGGFSRLLNGADVDWWPVAIAVLQLR